MIPLRSSLVSQWDYWATCKSIGEGLFKGSCIAKRLHGYGWWLRGCAAGASYLLCKKLFPFLPSLPPIFPLIISAHIVLGRDLLNLLSFRNFLSLVNFIYFFSLRFPPNEEMLKFRANEQHEQHVSMVQSSLNKGASNNWIHLLEPSLQDKNLLEDTVYTNDNILYSQFCYTFLWRDPCME